MAGAVERWGVAFGETLARWTYDSEEAAQRAVDDSNHTWSSMRAVMGKPTPARVVKLSVTIEEIDQ